MNRTLASTPARVAPVRARAARRAGAAKATAAKVAPVAVAAAAYAALAPAADAAMQVATLAEGEPLIVTLGWCATCAMFSFSLALVVWGRSGL